MSESKKWIVPAVIAVVVIVVVVAVAGILFLGQQPGGEEENEMPVVEIDSESVVVYASVSMWFDAGMSYDPDGEIESYEWDFGDGWTNSGETVDHIFDEEGEYEVGLTVIDDDGDSDWMAVYITVKNDIYITIDDNGWALWGLLNYYYLDITMTNHGNNDARTRYVWFEVEVAEGGKYEGVDTDGSPPDSLGKDDSASWRVWFNIPTDKTPESLRYSDLGHFIEVDI